MVRSSTLGSKGRSSVGLPPGQGDAPRGRARRRLPRRTARGGRARVARPRREGAPVQGREPRRARGGAQGRRGGRGPGRPRPRVGRGAGRRAAQRRDAAKRVVVTVDGLGAAYGDEVIFEDFSYGAARCSAKWTMESPWSAINGARQVHARARHCSRRAREGKLIGCTDAERNAWSSTTRAMTIALATVTVGYYAQTPLDAHDETSPMDYAVDVVSRRPTRARGVGRARGGVAAEELPDRRRVVAGAFRTIVGRRAPAPQLMAVLDANPDILVLDEPSNDLDLGALQSLERFLTNDFRGALLLVSHDRSLVDATCDKLLVLPGGRLRVVLRGLDERIPGDHRRGR